MEPNAVHTTVECDAEKDCSSPCREDARSILSRRINTLKSEIKGLEAILKALRTADPDAEEALWQIIQRAGGPY